MRLLLHNTRVRVESFCIRPGLYVLTMSIALILIPSVCVSGLTGVIRGKVISNSGSTVSEAEVVIEETGARATTTESGFFALVGIEPGTYTVTVSKGCKAETSVRGVRVHCDLSSNLSVRLGIGEPRVMTYSEGLVTEPRTAFLISGERVLSLPLSMPAQCIRTIPSRVEIDRFF